MILVGVGNHQLNGVAIPGTVGRVFVVVIGDDKTEVDIVGVIGNLNGRSLIVGSGPFATGVFFKELEFAVARTAFGDGETRVG